MNVPRNPYWQRKALIALLCGMIPFLAAGQSLRYEIRIGNNPVGILSVRQEVKGTVRKILIGSRVQSKLFSRMETDFETEYHNNVLYRARVVRLQGKPGENKETVTTKTEKGYTVVRKGNQEQINRPQITYTVSDLYFTEPKDVKTVYSEMLGIFLPVRQLPDKRYELSMPEGRKNLYRYEKGRLMEVEANHQLGKAFFRLMGSK